MVVNAKNCQDWDLAWFENTDGAGTFSNAIEIYSKLDFATSVCAADFDGDNDNDLLVADRHDNRVRWFKNTDGNGSFDIQAPDVDNNALSVIAVYAADFDGDNDMDFVSASWEDEEIAWSENTDGLGSFDNLPIVTSLTDGITCAYAADLDGDDDVDLISSSEYDEKIVWYENLDENGTFKTHKLFSSLDDANTVCTADLDGDDDLEILWAGERIGWHENVDGDFNFMDVIYTPATDIDANDMDGDGDNDIVFCFSSHNKIAWFENTDGNGNFGDEQIITSNANNVAQIKIIDLDNDNDMDILSKTSLGIYYYKNDGTGSFSDEKIHDAQGSVDTGDVDGDGDPDVVANYGDSIAWFENTGGFMFVHKIDNSAALSKVVDLDNDSDLDILSTRGSDDDANISWYENLDGQGNYGPEQNLFTANMVYTTADLNGDNRPDIITISNSRDRMAWHAYSIIPIPTLTTQDVSSITANAATANGTITDLSVPNPSQHVFCWNTTGYPTVEDNKTENGAVSETGTFTSDITGLSECTTYYLRTYAINDEGTAYGNEVSFTTLDNNPPTADLTSLDDVNAECEVTDLSAPTATDNCAGQITGIHDASLPITAQGTTVVTWTYDDGNGNTSTQTQNLVIEDIISPTIECIDNQTIELNQEETIYIVQGNEFDPLSTADNCMVSNIKNDFNNQSTLDGAEFSKGITTVEWSVTDIAGNTEICSYTIEVIDFVGVTTLNNPKIMIYPNPTNGILHITNAKPTIQHIRLFDITGKLLLEDKIIKSNAILDISHLEKGTYLLRILREKTITTTKLIKE